MYGSASHFEYINQGGASSWLPRLSTDDRVKHRGYRSSTWLHTVLHITVIPRERAMFAITVAIVTYWSRFFTRRQIYSSANEPKQRVFLYTSSIFITGHSYAQIIQLTKL